MCNLFHKEVNFEFDEMCLIAFEKLEKNLIESPILISFNWEWPFELMWDGIKVGVDTVLDRERVEYSSPFIMQAKPLTL